MEAIEVVSLLEENWNRLRYELGDQWQGFHRSYSEIVKRLPTKPERTHLEYAIDDLCNLLKGYDFGRGLLQGFLFQSSSMRAAKAAIDVTEDRESIQQLCNRLTELGSRKEQEVEKKEDVDKNESTDEDR
jgi:hypothetical protein